MAPARPRQEPDTAGLGSVVAIAVGVVFSVRRIVSQTDKVEKAVPKSWVGHVKAWGCVGQGAQGFGTQEAGDDVERGVLGSHP